MNVPNRISEAARARIAATTDQQARVKQAKQSGRLLDGELDTNRKIQRFQVVAHVNESAAKALAAYADPEKLGLEGDRLLGAERIQGKTTDFVGVSFVEEARSSATTVARVIFTDGRPQGSGFLISDRLFITNNHVIGSPAEAAQYLLEFNYELDPNGLARPVTRFALDPAAFFLTAGTDDLDFTVIAVGPRVTGPRDLGEFGSTPLIGSSDKHVLGEYVNVVQHPEGDFKQVVLRENQLVARLPTVLHYTADTMPGSSGSPVYNDQWEVVALHHWGEPHHETRLPDGSPADPAVNEGIRISAIVSTLQASSPRLSATQRALLDQALATSSARIAPQPPGEVAPVGAAPAIAPAAAPAIAPLTISIPSEVQAMKQIRIPFEIVINVGAPTDAATGAITLASTNGNTNTLEAGEKIAPDTNYSTRTGYNPLFLPGHRLDLPALTIAQKQHAARVRQGAGGNPFELKYTHFSIVVNAERKLAYFTAVNINGATWQDIDRTTGESLAESAESGEIWYQDPRIDPDEQSDQSMYSAQKPARVFDRGHLVRRVDPNWGTLVRARKANADTFHFTNCTPQQFQFNEQAKYWAGIENYILENAKAENEKVTVFTGPVLKDDDPAYRGLQVPMSFWKILARVENGQLIATALLAEQSELIKDLPERMSESLAEAFTDLGNVQQYQVSVKNIEELTGLNFGALRDHDSFHGGEGMEAIDQKRRIGTFQKLSLDLREKAEGERTPAEERKREAAMKDLAETMQKVKTV